MSLNMFVGHRCSTSIPRRIKFLGMMLQFSLKNLFQAYYQNNCWTENSPISAKACTKTGLINPPSPHDCRVKLLHLDGEHSTNHSILYSRWKQRHWLETNGQIPFSAGVASLKLDTSHFFLSSIPFVCKLGAFKAFKSPARRQRLRHQLCS